MVPSPVKLPELASWYSRFAQRFEKRKEEVLG